MNPISIYIANHEVFLHVGKYNIDIIGGWNIEEHFFTLNLINCENKKVSYPKRVKWKIQKIEFGTRSLRYFEIEIFTSGNHLIEFIKPESLIVKRTNLFITSLFTKPIPTEEIKIYFSNKS